MRRNTVFFPQTRTLRHSETVLLVDNYKPQIAKLHVILNHRMRTYKNMQTAVKKLGVSDITLFFRVEPVSRRTFIPRGATRRLTVS